MPTVEERIRARTIVEQVTRLAGSTPCFTWQGCTTNGYGTIQAGKRSLAGNRVPSYVHVLMYQILVGPIPDGMELDHWCRNRACWNPEHTEPVTRRTNIARGRSIVADYMVRDECGRGHPKTTENQYVRPDGKGVMCLPCRKLRSRRDYHQNNTEGEPMNHTTGATV